MAREGEDPATPPTPPAPAPETAETSTPTATADTRGTPDSNAAPATTETPAGSSGKSNTEILKAERDRIVGLSYKYNGKNTSVTVNSNEYNVNGSKKTYITRDITNAEIVDVVNDYPWILDKSVGSASDLTFGAQIAGSNGQQAVTYKKKNKIPVCYITERKSVVNATIANILGLLSTINDIGNNLEAAGNATGGWVSDGAKALSSAATSFKTTVNKAIGEYLPGFGSLLNSNNLNDEILNPYRYLYITADTGKRYVFPLTSKDSSCFITNKNAWGDPRGGQPAWLKALTKVVNTFNEVAGVTTNLIKNTLSLGGDASNADDNGSVREYAKTFTYPTKGDSIKIQFTLYNTTRKNAWRDNFRFLYLFAVRNLPFRTEMMSFTPPLLYDIIVPGIKRLPVCGLSQMKVDPQGMTRLLECDNFISGNGKIPVNVPEAWSVELTFDSLIATSANLMLANTIGKLNIDVSSDFENALKLSQEEADAVLDEMDEEAAKVQAACEAIAKSKKFDAALAEMKKAEKLGYALQARRQLQGAIQEMVDGTEIEVIDGVAYPESESGFNPYLTERSDDGTLRYKMPLQINPLVYTKLVETDPFAKDLVKHLTAQELKNPEKVAKALEPYMGTLGQCQIMDDSVYPPNKYGDPSKVNDGDYKANLAWGKAAHQLDGTKATGEMDPKAFENIKKALASDAHHSQTFIWSESVKSVIAGDKDSYPELTAEGAEYSYVKEWVDGVRPEGYLSAEAKPGEKSEREQAQATIDAYNRKVDELVAAGKGDVKLERLCDPQSTSTPEAAPSTST